VAVGGDGTLHAVVNGVLRAGALPVALVPAGRGNDLARTLRLPLDPGRATRLALTGVARRVDLARCGDRYAVSTAGVGLDARVAAAVRASGGGVTAYVRHALRELWRFAPVALRLRLDGEELREETTLVAVANGRYFGGGMLICPHASVRDGLLDVCVVGPIPRAELLSLLPRLYYGRHVGHPAVRFYAVRSVLIEGPAGTPTHLDGEPGPNLPLHIEAAPGGIELVLPGACRDLPERAGARSD
jgi:diacylglycerol kinase (ATP)